MVSPQSDDGLAVGLLRQLRLAKGREDRCGHGRVRRVRPLLAAQGRILAAQRAHFSSQVRIVALQLLGDGRLLRQPLNPFVQQLDLFILRQQTAAGSGSRRSAPQGRARRDKPGYTMRLAAARPAGRAAVGAPLMPGALVTRPAARRVPRRASHRPARSGAPAATAAGRAPCPSPPRLGTRPAAACAQRTPRRSSGAELWSSAPPFVPACSCGANADLISSDAVTHTESSAAV